MLAKDLISDVVPALKTSDTGAKALSWMDIFKITHLPIVNNQEFLGLISDKDIYDLNMVDEPIGNHNLSLFSPFVTDQQHVYDVLEIVGRLKLSVVPVLNEKKQYLGLITMHALVTSFADLAALNHPGGIIVLELNINDYSLSEIAQIVESNDAKILGLYISSPDDSTRIELTIKINRTELSSIIQTFNRYNYNIKASFLENDELDNLYNNRYEAFIRYLNV
ncbi:MAG: CBS domain-containing protein [Bacteroidales bacterium]